MRPTDISSANSDYIDQLYEQFQQDPASVDPEWAAFFKGFDVGYRRSEAEEAAAEAEHLAPGGQERRKRERTEARRAVCHEAEGGDLADDES